MQQYYNLVQKIQNGGQSRVDRTKVGTRSIFGERLTFDLTESFPLVTLKRTSFDLIVSELLWFLKGCTNVKELHKDNNHIWDEWANSSGELGPIYGAQWRSWPTVIPFHNETFTVFKPLQVKVEYTDQLQGVIEEIRHNPTSRRLLVSAWNVSQIDEMALPPCHIMFQFYVRGEYLDCQVYQRSADVFLGVPFNIASYALLTHMVAQVTGKKAGKLNWIGGDCHIYDNHKKQIAQMMLRFPQIPPTLKMNSLVTSIDEFSKKDFEIMNYNPHAAISAPIAV